jgi:hypothetical protein
MLKGQKIVDKIFSRYWIYPRITLVLPKMEKRYILKIKDIKDTMNRFLLG